MKLVLKDLNKSFGEKEVLKNIDFTFQEGKIYAIIGKNGAGKTTLFHCIENRGVKDSGEIFLEKAKKEEINAMNFGFVSANPMIPEYLTGYEFLSFFLKVNKIQTKTTVEEYFAQIQIDEKDMHKLIKEYSLGMKSKLQILLYLILKPDVLLLDEPLTSFDIIATKEIKDLLKKEKQNRIIIFSTHILELAKSMSDEIVILNKGQLQKLPKSTWNKIDFENQILEILKDERNI